MKRAKHVEFMTFTEAFEMLDFMSLFASDTKSMG